MKRDMDVVREILLATESAGPGGLSSNVIATGSNQDVVAYNAELLVEAGMLRGEVVRYIGSVAPNVCIQRLTWDGHDFLDAIRDDTVWNETKVALLDTAGTAALEVVKALAVSISRTALGLPPA